MSSGHALFVINVAREQCMSGGPLLINNILCLNSRWLTRMLTCSFWLVAIDASTSMSMFREIVHEQIRSEM